jgi:putative Mn2+ efflux pump MntP
LEEAGLTNLEIAAVAFALAVDAFSVAASAAPRLPRNGGAARMAASFGLFQAAMPLLGALAGAYLLTYVKSYDHWVAFGLLELVGLKMVIEAFRGRDDPESADSRSLDPSRGWTLLTLSVATSIDAFGAGVGLRMAGANLWVASPVIGIVAAALTYLGVGLGRTARGHLGRRAEVLGGVVLIVLGIEMLQI